MLDQAGWHITDKLVIPANITQLLVPPKVPELNQVENVRQYFRDNWFSNRVFGSHGHISDHCREAGDKRVDQLWCIMSIGLRQWARRS